MSIQQSIIKAREIHKSLIEQTYEDTCTVIEHQMIKNPVTSIKEATDVTVLTDQPCKLSFSTAKKAGESDNVATVNQVIKLFLPPNVTINAGSKVNVTSNGITTSYKNTGIPNRYATHQEIVLELFERWA